MGKLKKEGKVGAAANYLSRNQAIKRLQLSLSDFRRLCILKGIFPREPKNRTKLKKSGKNVAADQVFYHLKDIQIMQHEPLMDKFRELRAFAKKVKRLVGREEYTKVKLLDPPKYTLDHLIRERYPTFTDAIEDLDDALSMAALFAQLPKQVTEAANDTMKPLEKQRVDMARSCFALMRQWEAWVMKSGALRKAFVSIKGIYYQAEVNGRPVTWLSPLDFAHIIPNDVDFRVMATFLEFYQTLLRFVNYRLFAMVGWTFPFPVESMEALQAGAERPVLLSELPLAESQNSVGLLKEAKVFLSREVPRRALAFMCQSMGCESIGWASLEETSPIQEDDPSITHQIVDRPSLSVMIPGRHYVQPQWLFDSLNAGKLLDCADYKIGANLPAHLSPFVAAEENTPSPVVQEITPEQAEAAEQKKLSVALLSKKKRKLYERIQHSRARKADAKQKLAARKAALKQQQQ